MKKRILYACLLGLIVALSLGLCAAESADTAGADLRIMSFNIMHPDWSRVPVKGRDEIVSEILRAYRPDVAALQEAGAKWHKALKPLLVDTGLYAQACRQCNAEGFIYCCTTFLYDPGSLRLVEETVLDLDPRDAARVLSAAVFERISDGARFVVTNTHPAPREQPEDHQRNMAGLMALISDLRMRYAGLPLIMAGDFHTPEQDGYYPELMERAGVRDAKYEADTLVRGCSTFFGWGSAPDPGSADLCVDHIFVSPGVGVRRFEAVIGHGVEQASDHIPIVADIYFGPDQRTGR
ncbi:MAG: endonuclease/exonuclease/phosphatase family protein [Clostridia bacterium]|nr:endonuclease/exonuclease/phosphatase family protein [Clostridia bacterium]